MRTRISTILILAGLLVVPALFGAGNSFGLTVLVDDSARPEYSHNGTLYVEAIRGSSYALRLTNPTPYRVAVALSVDGLNTIDARHSDARGAAKWVLEPRVELVPPAGRSTSARRAISFYGRAPLYGAQRTDRNSGAIGAVFYRERRPGSANLRRRAAAAAQADNEARGGGSSSARRRLHQKDALSTTTPRRDGPPRALKSETIDIDPVGPGRSIRVP
jgi:hypothetical protein